jgi:uncharacterized membrane protein YgcG
MDDLDTVRRDAASGGGPGDADAVLHALRPRLDRARHRHQMVVRTGWAASAIVAVVAVIAILGPGDGRRVDIETPATEVPAPTSTATSQLAATTPTATSANATATGAPTARCDAGDAGSAVAVRGTDGSVGWQPAPAPGWTAAPSTAGALIFANGSQTLRCVAATGADGQLVATASPVDAEAGPATTAPATAPATSVTASTPTTTGRPESTTTVDDRGSDDGSSGPGSGDDSSGSGSGGSGSGSGSGNSGSGNSGSGSGNSGSGNSGSGSSATTSGDSRGGSGSD